MTWRERAVTGGDATEMMERGCSEERRVVRKERDVMEMKRGDRAERKKI